MEERKKRAKELKLCYKCLKTNHGTKNCDNKSRPCHYCTQKHNVLFCKASKEQKQPISSSFLSHIHGYFKNKNYLSD